MRAGQLATSLATLYGILEKDRHNHNAAQILALALVQSGKHEDALPYLEAAIAAEPSAIQYRNNYANVLLHLTRYEAAAAQWSESLRIDPQYAMGWLGLACAKLRLRDSTGALEAAEQGLELRPGWPELIRVLVLALECAGCLDDALDVCRRALGADPSQRALRSTYLLLLNYGSDSADAIADSHREFGRLHASDPNPPQLDRTPDRPLRVGMLTADLRTHSVAFFAEPLLRHTPGNVILTVFSSAATPSDPMTIRLKDLAGKWIEVGAMDDSTLNRCIREHEIDVLLEMNGHTSGHRLEALADKPAPVMITAIGYPNTTGMPSMDWRVCDSVTDPMGAEAYSTERLLRLDPCFLCYSPPLDAPRPVFPLDAVSVTFGSFNAISKMNTSTAELWSSAVNSVPNSRLLLKTQGLSDPTAREVLLARFAEAGIPPERIDIVPYSATIREHLEVYSRIHVALDTTPYNGTTTTCEALWMGVPVVCLLGDRHAARVSASILTAIGCTHLIAGSTAEYISIANRLATSTSELEFMRFELREMMRRSPLTDAVSYADRFYTAVRACWVDWCNALPSSRLDLELS